MTVGNAIQELNDKHCHEMGFHVAMIPMKHLPEEMTSVELPHHLLRQTYDWRYHEPEKEEYTVILTAADMRFLGHAIEVYDQIMFDLHMKPHMETIMKKMGEVIDGEEH